ncbi:accessory gene regulator B family protein [Blautia faecis]|uniref:accessory gene regulator B family protein n=1 Tax=Blautia faecis TaxID=871665 RepID=UPI003A7F4C5D
MNRSSLVSEISFIEMLSCLLACFGIAVYLHMIPEFAVVTGIFMMLRSFVGGVHLNSFDACFMCSVTVQTLVLVVNRLYTQPLNLAWGIIVLSSVLIWNMAPVQSINRELDADEKKHCRKVAVKIIVGIYVFAGICTLTGMNAIVSLVAVTMAAVLISQYIGVVKYKIEKR